MKTIRIYGDSILKGVIYNEALKRYKLCSYHFDELENDGIVIENNCKMGATIDTGFEIMRDTLPECEKGDLVVLEYGGNDCNYDWSKVSENPSGDFLCSTPEDRFVKVYSEMIEYARSKGASVAVSTLVPIESGRFMKWISRGLNYDNILSWLGDINMLARWQEYYSHLSESVAKKESCQVIDLRSCFLLPRRLDRMICEDGIHPNESGHELIKETFQKNIRNDFALA